MNRLKALPPFAVAIIAGVFFVGIFNLLHIQLLAWLVIAALIIFLIYRYVKTRQSLAEREIKQQTAGK